MWVIAPFLGVPTNLFTHTAPLLLMCVLHLPGAQHSFLRTSTTGRTSAKPTAAYFLPKSQRVLRSQRVLNFFLFCLWHQLRKLISDFSIFMSIMTFVGLDMLMGLKTPKLIVPTEFKVQQVIIKLLLCF